MLYACREMTYIASDMLTLNPIVKIINYTKIELIKIIPKHDEI